MVYVAAMGPLWSSGGERGLYKTTDGGATWEQVLTIDEWTGVYEVHLHPRNPDVLYASSYQRQRRALAQLTLAQVQQRLGRRDLALRAVSDAQADLDTLPGPPGPDQQLLRGDLWQLQAQLASDPAAQDAARQAADAAYVAAETGPLTPAARARILAWRQRAP